MTEPAITAAAVRALAAAAADLAARVTAAQVTLRADPDPHRARAGYRFDVAAGQLGQVTAALLETADDLARIAAVPAGACGIGWGVCPDHGNTLTGSGGRAWCRHPGCGRTWGYDRLMGPCPEPVTHAVVDAAGTRFRVCTGHAMDCRDNLDGATVTALPAPGTGR